MRMRDDLRLDGSRAVGRWCTARPIISIWSMICSWREDKGEGRSGRLRSSEWLAPVPLGTGVVDPGLTPARP